MNTRFDCIIAGSCVIDMLCRPVTLNEPIGKGVLHLIEPMHLTGGGLASNTGIAMARLGMRIGICSYVGDDAWAAVLRDLYRREAVDDSLLAIHPTEGTSTAICLIDGSGERSFYHCVGAPQMMDGKFLLDRINDIAQSRFVLVGYYGLMPNLEPDLPEVFRRLRLCGCRTALESAGAGGTMQPLNRILPHIDVYVPSFNEARNQTGREDPKAIIATYRQCGAPGLLGVKLGKNGVVLSPAAGEYFKVPALPPPGPIIDTTGAGDSFYAGLLTGIIKGLSFKQSARLATASAAFCITSIGGSTGGRPLGETAALAKIDTQTWEQHANEPVS